MSFILLEKGGHIPEIPTTKINMLETMEAQVQNIDCTGNGTVPDLHLQFGDLLRL
jgi:hypothetical protein